MIPSLGKKMGWLIATDVWMVTPMPLDAESRKLQIAEEIAEFLQVTPRSVYFWANEGRRAPSNNYDTTPAGISRAALALHDLCEPAHTFAEYRNGRKRDRLFPLSRASRPHGKT
jgi:hypothetical protein